MSDTYLMEVIRTTELAGEGVEDDPYHRHIQFYTTGGELLAEKCDSEWCDGGDS